MDQQPESQENVASSVAPPVVEKMTEADVLALELAKSRRETALAEAKAALANNEKADLSYKYTILQLYMKYGLTQEDAIAEDGRIVRGGAKTGSAQ